MPRLPIPPLIDWTAEGAPRSIAFGDIYFSRAGGLAETEAVFLAGCGLPDAWKGRRCFVIGELGFGTGLNALAAWRLWRAARPAGAVLHFVSIEAHPLPKTAAHAALAAFPELAELADKLLARWPWPVRGAQRRWFAEDGFCLTLLTGPADESLADFPARVDAWFLDGFSPARNEAMWSDALMRQVAAHSRPGARLATYSVAAKVREALTNAGFSIRRRPGFGGKRERLEAVLTADPAQRHAFLPRRGSPPAPGPIAIVGGGVAGAAAAYALSLRGVAADLFDPGAGIEGAGGSFNPAALFMPRLDRADTAQSRFFIAAYLHALDAYGALGPPAYRAIGVTEPAAPERVVDFAADPILPPELLSPDDGALRHALAGVLNPSAVLPAWSAASRLCRLEVAGIARAEGGWMLSCASGRRYGPFAAVILAAGRALGSFEPCGWLPLSISRGQLDWAPLQGDLSAPALAAGAYAAPLDGRLYFGATFDPWPACGDPTPSWASTARNLGALVGLAPRWAARLDMSGRQARAALRASTPDRTPFAGLAPDAPAFLQRHARLRLGQPPDLTAPAPALDGLYLIGGLGARGFLTAPLLGEILASDLLDEPSPLPPSALAACHPARFLERALKKGRQTPWTMPPSSFSD